MKPLVTIAHIEVWVQLLQVKWNASNAVSAINTAQDAMIAAEFSETLIRHANAWLGNNSIIDGDTWVLALGLDLFDRRFELVAKIRVRDWICVFDTLRRRGCSLSDICHSLTTSTIDCSKVYDDIARLVDKVAKHSVGASGGIWNEDTSFDWGIEELCDGLARLVEQLRVVVSNEHIRSLFCKVLEMAKNGFDFCGICAE